MRRLSCFALLLPTTLLYGQGTTGTDLGLSVLRKLADVHATTRTVTGSFVQSVTTEILDKPIVTKGSLVLRRSPPCAVFLVDSPKKAVCRIDDSSYQVYRPAQREAERYIFPRDTLSSTLVSALVPGRSEELQKHFEIRKANRSGKNVVEVRLEPKLKRIQNYVVWLVLSVDVAKNRLSRVAYRTKDGDEVTISIKSVRINPVVKDETFSAEVPKGTKVMVHHIKAKY